MNKRMVTLCGALVLLAGCSTEAGENTKMGAMAGGAIGAGLGAIVGSTSGDAGTGLLIGAAVGAGTGAVVGNTIDEQDGRTRTQDEAIERQRQLIKAQRTEIDELRRTTQEPLGGSFASTSTIQERSLTEGASWNNASTRQTGLSAPAATSAPVSSRSSFSKSLELELQKARDAEQRAALRTPVRTASVSRRAPAPVKRTAVRAVVPAPKAERQAPEPDTVIEEQPSEPALAEPEDTTSAAAWGEGDATDVGAASAVFSEGAVTADASVSGVTEDCLKAAKEVSQGDSAGEASDKLFHLRRALRLCPDNASYHNKLGEVYRSLNRTADAQFEFREALNIDPGHQAARDNLSSIR